MKTILIAIKDLGVEAFQQPLSVRAKGEATRWFIDLVNDPQNKNIHNHPQDYELYTLGTYDDQTGTIESALPERIMRGTDAKRSA